MLKEQADTKILRTAELAILTGVILIMTFTPIGYIKTAGLEITLIPIPVIVGAIVLGPGAGAFLGGVFGVTSFLQGVLALSPFGVMLMEISLVRFFLVCIPTRILMGFCTGCIWKAFNGESVISYSVTSVCGSLLNTLFFMGTLLLFYWNTELIQGIAHKLGATNVFAFTAAFVGVNGIVEAVACFLAAAAISKAVNKYIMTD